MNTTEQNTSPELPKISYGEYLVGIKFNVAGDPNVDLIKRLTAQLIDTCKQLSDQNPNPQAKRAYAVAITEYQTGGMWAVMGATKPELPEHLIGK